MVAGGLVGLRFQPRRMLLAATLAILLMPGVLVTLGFPLALPVIVGAAFLAGVGIEMFGILWDTTMQQQIPGEMLSRLYSYDMVGSIALVPIGYAVAGPVAEVLGVQTTLWAAAGVVGCRHTARAARPRRPAARAQASCSSPLTSSL